MRKRLIICVLLLAGCSSDEPFAVAPTIPADLLTGCPGYTGPVPRTERDIVLVVVAEKRGRECANAKIETIAGMIGPQ